MRQIGEEGGREFCQPVVRKIQALEMRKVQCARFHRSQIVECQIQLHERAETTEGLVPDRADVVVRQVQFRGALHADEGVVSNNADNIALEYDCRGHGIDTRQDLQPPLAGNKDARTLPLARTNDFSRTHCAPNNEQYHQESRRP